MLYCVLIALVAVVAQVDAAGSFAASAGWETCAVQSASVPWRWRWDSCPEACRPSSVHPEKHDWDRAYRDAFEGACPDLAYVPWVVRRHEVP